MNEIGDPLTLPDNDPRIKNSVGEPSEETELRDTYLISKKYASDVNN